MDPESLILEDVKKILSKRMNDGDSSVVRASMRAMVQFAKVTLSPLFQGQFLTARRIISLTGTRSLMRVLLR